MISPIKQLAALIVIVLLLAACNSETSWTEEVRTANGATIEVKRQEWRWMFARASLLGSSSPQGQKLTASVPGIGKVMWHEDDYSMSRPLAFDVVDGTPWLVRDNDHPCDRDPTDEPLRVSRYEKGNWVKVPMRDAPRRLEANLLQFSAAESMGDLGKRPYQGKCGLPPGAVPNRYPDVGTLRYRESCGLALDALAEVVIRNGRNCSLKYPPRHADFRNSWSAYLQAPVKQVEGRVTAQDVPAPALPEFRKGVRGTYIAQGQDVFSCAIGCKEDQLLQVIEYGERLRRENVVEFLLAGPEKRTFYAQVARRPAMLLCDAQGYKLLRLEGGGKTDPSRVVHAVHFDRSGSLVGKWAITLPPSLSGPGSDSASRARLFVHGLDVLESELRIWLGRGGRDDACSAYRKVLGAYDVTEVRADR